MVLTNMKSLKLIVYSVTLFVVVYAMLSQMYVPFPLVLFCFLFAQGLLIYMIWRILRIPYKTNKTFNDWYQDKEIRH